MSVGVGPFRFYSGGGRKRPSPPTPPSVAAGIILGVLVGVLAHSFVLFVIVFSVVSIGGWWVKRESMRQSLADANRREAARIAGIATEKAARIASVATAKSDAEKSLPELKSALNDQLIIETEGQSKTPTICIFENRSICTINGLDVETPQALGDAARRYFNAVAMVRGRRPLALWVTFDSRDLKIEWMDDDCSRALI